MKSFQSWENICLCSSNWAWIVEYRDQISVNQNVCSCKQHQASSQLGNHSRAALSANKWFLYRYLHCMLLHVMFAQSPKSTYFSLRSYSLLNHSFFLLTLAPHLLPLPFSHSPHSPHIPLTLYLTQIPFYHSSSHSPLLTPPSPLSIPNFLLPLPFFHSTFPTFILLLLLSHTHLSHSVRPFPFYHSFFNIPLLPTCNYPVYYFSSIPLPPHFTFISGHPWVSCGRGVASNR